MKRVIVAAVATGLLSFSFIGCAEKSTSTTKTETKTPGGSTTVKDQKTVEKTGDHKDK